MNPKWFRGIVLATYLLVSMFGLPLHRITGCPISGCGPQIGHSSVCTHTDHGTTQIHDHSAKHSHAGHDHHCGIDRDESTAPQLTGGHRISHSPKLNAQNIDSQNGQPRSEWQSDHAGLCSTCDQLWSLSQFGFAVCESIAAPNYDAVSFSPQDSLASPESIRIEPASRGPPADLSA